MPIINTFNSPSIPEDIDAIVQDALKEPYDVNSCVPVPTILENERLAIVPFIPSIHAEPFFDVFKKESAPLMKYLPVPFGGTVKEFIVTIETRFRRSQASVLFAIIDKTRPPLDAYPDIRPAGQIAGLLGFINASASNLSFEIGPVVILQDFQGTFVSSNAIGLVLKYALDPPSQGGLAYRRVVWCADPRNEKSVVAAEKAGFKKEGILKWNWVLPEGKEGKEVNTGRLAFEAGIGRGLHHGRDSVVLSVCWDDWTGGVREIIEERMKRK